MRGPGLRLDLDVRRTWTCPACQRSRKLLGDNTSPLCPCRDGGVPMTLTSESRLLRRAERINPLPYLKHPGMTLPEREREPKPVSEPQPTAVLEHTTPESAAITAPAPETVDEAPGEGEFAEGLLPE